MMMIVAGLQCDGGWWRRDKDEHAKLLVEKAGGA